MFYCYNYCGDDMKNKKLLKIAITVIIVIITCYLIYDNYYLIANKLEYLYSKYIKENVKQTLNSNEYQKNENYEYVKINKNAKVKEKDDIEALTDFVLDMDSKYNVKYYEILNEANFKYKSDNEIVKNAIYTFLDNGWNKYILKCDSKYETCLDDFKSIVENNVFLTDLSNFVHPFNTFNKINTTFTSTGNIILKKEDRYKKNEIEKINKKIDQIYNENYDKNKTIEENIKTFHDYIINTTKYDKTNTSGNSNVSSSTAYGVLFDGIGICSGYSDAMSLFLDKMKIKNYRISSDTHEWNLVYINGVWKHLDLTWDDPITSDDSDIISHDYFLIDEDVLKSKSDKEHLFNENVYKEAKKAVN